jgi:hypothetical protein
VAADPAAAAAAPPSEAIRVENAHSHNLRGAAS